MYDKSADIWTVGCIFAELYRKRPLFSKNTKEEVLKDIFDTIGYPT